MSTSPVYAATLRNFTLTIANNNLNPAYTQNTILAYAGALNGARIDSIVVINTDTSPHDVQVYINNGGGNTLIATCNVVGSGGNTVGTPARSILGDANNIFTISDPYGNRVMYLQANANVSIRSLSPITNQASLIVLGMAGEF